jgi:hypothetical protein
MRHYDKMAGTENCLFREPVIAIIQLKKRRCVDEGYNESSIIIKKAGYVLLR